MMNKMKYIIVNNGLFEAPVIFDEAMKHDEMAATLCGWDSPKVISAGFIRFSKEGLQCYGESVSLKKKARPEEDSAIINKMLGV